MLDFIIKILVCFILSACIGVERQYRGRKAGLRTVILVGLGSFLFVNFSFAFTSSDQTRIASQVVAGIGFLGAGVIMIDSKNVKGLTTAATLWCSAAIGILCAANQLFEASIGSLFILFTNIVLRKINSRINSISGKGIHNTYHLTMSYNIKYEKELLKLAKYTIEKNKGTINQIETEEDNDGNVKADIIIFDSSLNNKLFQELLNELSGKEEILSISLNKGQKDTFEGSEEI